MFGTLSVRPYLVLLLAAVLAPALLLAGILAFRFANAERAQYEGNVASSAAMALAVVERELSGLVATLQALASSPNLDSGDLEAFHRQAAALNPVLGTGVVLRDVEGHQLANTRLPWGTPLPARSSLSGWDDEVLRDRRPLVSDHYVGIVGDEHRFGVVVPVLRDGGEVRYLLHLSVPATRLRAILASIGIEPDWETAVIDRRGIVLARTHGYDAAVGAPTSVIRNLSARAGSVSGRITDRNGREVFFAAKRSGAFGWSVVTMVPTEVIDGPLRRVFWTVLGFGTVLVGVSLLAAYALGTRLAVGIRGLAAAGAAIGRGGAVRPAPSAIREIDEVGEALAGAAEDLRARLAERDAAARQQRLVLRELDHRVKNTLATVQALATLTAQEAPDVATYRTRLTERLQGLSRTQALLTRGGGMATGLREVIRAELAMHEDGAGERITLDGPPVVLPWQSSAALGMVVHELATNAAKYGALSGPSSGRLRVAWRVTGQQEVVATAEGVPPRLELSWEESGGPPVAEPRRAGFGTRMIERGLARQLRAEVAFDFRREGLRFRLSMPLQDQAAPEAAEQAPSSPRPVA